MDSELLHSFKDQVAAKIPHRAEDGSVSGATPLRDITEEFLECAGEVYGIDLSQKVSSVYAKFDSEILGGSIKVRPAVRILEQAIASGKLKRGQTVFEATSGNFGIALGLLGTVGIQVVALVSRKLQEGVVEELERSGVKIIDLDVEICPALRALLDITSLAAKAATSNVRSRLAELGFSPERFDGRAAEMEGLLARQDAINLAKLLAEVYDGFSTEQYDNEMNVKAHETITGPEIDQQLRTMGETLRDFGVVCTFGTGGTSLGLSRYLQGQHQRKAVHVVFPLAGQEVAGIRSRSTADGLRFYRPAAYAGEHEVDFEAARRLMSFFVDRGFNIGESSALALYATVQLANYGAGDRFVVIIADGVKKYERTLATVAEARTETVSLQQARDRAAGYGMIIWTHQTLVPKEEGFRLLASAMGREEGEIAVVGAEEVQRIVSTNRIPRRLFDSVSQSGNKHLFVCMAGVTSLRVAQAFAAMGLRGDNLAGGMMALAATQRRQVSELVRPV